MSNQTNNEPSMVRQLHILACAILGLDDEDHEDDEQAAPLEQVINLYAQKMILAELKKVKGDTSLSPDCPDGCKEPDPTSPKEHHWHHVTHKILDDRITSIEKE